VARVYPAAEDGGPKAASLLRFEGADWEIPTLRVKADQVLVRLFNPSPDGRAKKVHYGARASKVELVRLSGQVLKEIPVRQDAAGGVVFDLALPPMGVSTLRITP
jgi:hypothetical protein